jgi:hypothetical protein
MTVCLSYKQSQETLTPQQCTPHQSWWSSLAFFPLIREHTESIEKPHDVILYGHASKPQDDIDLFLREDPEALVYRGL